VTIPGPHTSIMAGLNCGTPSKVAWPLVSEGFDVFAAIADDRARDAMRMLAHQAGVVAGETGAAGLGGLLAALSDGAPDDVRERVALREDSCVLLLSTEGATDPAAYRRIVGKSV
jgi:diaminopropionate ammonia-lyase